MSDINFLSNEDVEILQGLINREKTNRRNPPSRYPVHLDEPIANQVLVVYTPAGGIPAVNQNGTTGTGTGSGTIGVWDDVPGTAECYAYMIVHDTTEHLRYIGRTVTVYNISNIAVAGSKFILAVKDIYGCWIAAAGGLGLDFDVC